MAKGKICIKTSRGKVRCFQGSVAGVGDVDGTLYRCQAVGTNPVTGKNFCADYGAKKFSKKEADQYAGKRYGKKPYAYRGPASKILSKSEWAKSMKSGRTRSKKARKTA